MKTGPLLSAPQPYLWEVAVEAGYPAALRAGLSTAEPLFAKDLVAALGIGAPGQVGTALHVASEESFLILQREK